MTIGDLAKCIEARLLTEPHTGHVPIHYAYAGDRVSDLLNAVSDGTLLVTNLGNASLRRVIELMDAPAVCLLNGVEPEDDLMAAAAHGAAVIVSPYGMFETCGRLFAALRGAGGASS